MTRGMEFVANVLNSESVPEILPVPEVVIGNRMIEYLTSSWPVDAKVLGVLCAVAPPSKTLTFQNVNPPTPVTTKKFVATAFVLHQLLIRRIDDPAPVVLISKAAKSSATRLHSIKNIVVDGALPVTEMA